MRLKKGEWKKAETALSKVFRKLNQMGLVAMQNAGYTQSNGFDDCVEEYNTRDERDVVVGFCFYTNQDLDRAKELDAVNMLLSRQIAPSKFYAEQLDGVFDAEGLTQEATQFTVYYFDFEKGNYINDYLALFDPHDELPSLFHVARYLG